MVRKKSSESIIRDIKRQTKRKFSILTRISQNYSLLLINVRRIWPTWVYNQLGLRFYDTIGGATKETRSPLFSQLNQNLRMLILSHISILQQRSGTKKCWQHLYQAYSFRHCHTRFCCPMAKDDFTGNMPTEKIILWY